MAAAAPSRAAPPQNGGSSALLKRMAMGLPPAPSTKSAKAISGAWRDRADRKPPSSWALCCTVPPSAKS